MEDRVESALPWLVAPFEVPSIRATIIAGYVVPCDAKSPALNGEGAQERELEDVAHVAGVLIAHAVPKPVSRLLSLRQRSPRT